MQIPLDKLVVVLGLVLAYLVFTEMVKLAYIRTFREKMVVDEKRSRF